MSTYSKVLLSGSSYGAPIKVAATSSPGTTIHATGTSASVIDEVNLFAYNSSAAAIVLTLQVGGTSSPDNDLKLSIPATSGLTFVLPGISLSGTGAAATSILAYAGATNVVTVWGFVNRII